MAREKHSVLNIFLFLSWKDRNEGLNEQWAWNRFDASAFYPSSGMSSDLNLIHFPGSYSGCLAINDKHPDKPKEEFQYFSQKKIIHPFYKIVIFT